MVKLTTALPIDIVATLAFWHSVVVELEEWNCVKRLFADADEITADAAIQDPLLRHQHQLAVNLEESDSWGLVNQHVYYFTSSFYGYKSQKRKKTVKLSVSFCGFG